MNAKSTKPTSSSSMSKSMSKKDWKRFDAMKDEEIDCSDIPELDESFWKNAKLVMPQKRKSIALRVDEDVLHWFKAQGKLYQSRMAAVLRAYMEASKR